MMPRRKNTTCLAALLISLAAVCQAAQTATTDHELYSWKVKGHWYYSLLPGTNRSRSYEEITAPRNVRRDASGLQSELQKLQKGDEIFWMSTAPVGASKSVAGQRIDVKHPSRKRIENIKAICDKLGIKLKLS